MVSALMATLCVSELKNLTPFKARGGVSNAAGSSLCPLEAASYSKLGKLKRHKLGQREASSADEEHSSVSCLGVFWFA